MAFGIPDFTHVGTLTFPSGVLGLIDPCQINPDNEHANPDEWGALIALGFDGWDAHTRLIDGEVAELRLVPTGTSPDRISIDWDGTYPDLNTRGAAIRAIGEVGIYTSTLIAIDPTHRDGFNFTAHVHDVVEDATAWAIPTTDITGGAIVTTTGCGTGAYDIHLVTATDGGAMAVVINFGLDHEISRCSECSEPDGHCRCEPCNGCGDYLTPDCLNADGNCDDCAAEAAHNEAEDDDESCG